MWMIYTKRYQLLQLNLTMLTLHYQKRDTIMSYLIVSPDMHKVHHHYKLPYTDSNYGNIFSVWDRLFGTFTLPKEEIVYH
jgi:sterol desaturase/sphingolipid hydroxylase (fatty acid hydroxylase superfamily)